MENKNKEYYLSIQIRRKTENILDTDDWITSFSDKINNLNKIRFILIRILSGIEDSEIRNSVYKKITGELKYYRSVSNNIDITLTYGIINGLYIYLRLYPVYPEI